MNSLRIGCDRIIRWSITSGGEPYDLSGKNIRLKVSTRTTQFYVSTDDFSIDGNKIIWLFRGKDQKHLGPYTLTYIENEGMDDMLTFDRCNAFNFVACSCQESRSSSKDMEISNIDLSSEITALGVKLLPNLIPLTYQELFFLRASSGLIPGQFYRITDYVTATSQENTRSAGHQFDVIVLALTNDTLAERAWACHHEGDTYFQNFHLEAWQIWYCLDNDTSRFEWAVPSTSGGKGVIYRMIDEFNNDCPYDFKNIQYYNNEVWLYTFSNSSDLTGYSYNNTITAHIYTQRQRLNWIIFGNNCHDNSFGNNCYDNSFGNNCRNNRFGNGCYNNSFEGGCGYNSFGNGCYNNSFGKDCGGNSFGNCCYSNSFGSECSGNSFGSSCHSNSFGNFCRYNSFGNKCYSNIFGNNWQNNSFGNKCYSNSFGNSCYSNIFGNNCYSNSFGSECFGNSFGSSCKSNSFEGNCRYNSFGNNCHTNSFGIYCRYNRVEDGVNSVTLSNSQTASSNQQVQNYHLTRGLTEKKHRS